MFKVAKALRREFVASNAMTLARGADAVMNDFLDREYIEPLTRAVESADTPDERGRLLAQLDDFSKGRKDNKKFWGRQLWVTILGKVDRKILKDWGAAQDLVQNVLMGLVEKKLDYFRRKVDPEHGSFGHLKALYNINIKTLLYDALRKLFGGVTLVTQEDEQDNEPWENRIEDPAIEREQLRQTFRDMWRFVRRKLTEEQKGLLEAWVDEASSAGKVKLSNVIREFKKRYKSTKSGQQLRNVWAKVLPVLKDFFRSQKGYVMPKTASSNIVTRLAVTEYRRRFAAWMLGV